MQQKFPTVLSRFLPIRTQAPPPPLLGGSWARSRHSDRIRASKAPAAYGGCCIPMRGQSRAAGLGGRQRISGSLGARDTPGSPFSPSPPFFEPSFCTAKNCPGDWEAGSPQPSRDPRPHPRWRRAPEAQGALRRTARFRRFRCHAFRLISSSRYRRGKVRTNTPVALPEMGPAERTSIRPAASPRFPHPRGAWTRRQTTFSKPASP